jgi:hypothetical protein
VGVLEAIGGLFGSVAGGIADLAKKVWEGVRAVYNFAATVFDLVGGADHVVAQPGQAVHHEVPGAAARVLHLLEWVTLHMIPRAVAFAISHAIGWARGAVHEAKHWLEGRINEVGSWARRELHKLLADLRAGFRAIWKPLADAWSWVEHTGKAIAHLLAKPERLAAWLVGALVLPLLQFLIRSSAGILALLFRAFRREAGEFAHTLEAVLAKLI